MQHSNVIISCILSCALALLLVSVPSYAFLTSEGEYVEILDDPQWLAELPGGLSSEVASFLGDTLLLSSSNEAAVEAYIAGTVTSTWAKEQGERVIISVVAYISSDNPAIDGTIDISIFRQSLLGMLYGIVPPYFLDLLIEYVPSELPLSLMMDSDSMEGIREMISVLGILRYISLVLCCALGVVALLGRKVIPVSTWGYGIGGAGMLTAMGVVVVYSRIRFSFDATLVEFISSYGALFANSYLHYMIPYLIVAIALIACSIVTYVLRRSAPRPLR